MLAMEQLNIESKFFMTSIKDFWQTDFFQGSWEITYDLNLDSPEDERITREFRFWINKN